MKKGIPLCSYSRAPESKFQYTFPDCRPTVADTPRRLRSCCSLPLNASTFANEILAPPRQESTGTQGFLAATPVGRFQVITLIVLAKWPAAQRFILVLKGNTVNVVEQRGPFLFA